MQQAGHDVEVAYVLPYKDAWVARLEESGIRCTCLAPHGQWALAMWPRYRRLLARLRPDVVHAHLPITGVLARAYKWRFRYSLVYTEHNELTRLNGLTRWAHQRTRRIDDLAISCSSAVAESLPWDSTVIDNGIGAPPAAEACDLRTTHSIPSSAVVFMCVANMTPKKNHSLLLKAFDRVCQAVSTDIRLVLVGQDATEGERLKAYAKQVDSAAQIVFYGVHPDAQLLMLEADVFVLASRHEGLPISLLEAMAVRLPTVVTSAGGMPNVVTPECGLVVPIDDEARLVDAMTVLAGDSEKRAAMGAAAAARVQSMYSEAEMVRQIEGQYRQLLESAQSSSS